MEGSPLMIGTETQDCYATEINYGPSGKSFVSGICCLLSGGSCSGFLIYFDVDMEPIEQVKINGVSKDLRCIEGEA